MTIKEFEQRAKFNGGYDREFGEWKVIDIHEIPKPFLEQHEMDFYCCNGNEVYLLRLRNRRTENYVQVANDNTLTYLIAELPISSIDNNLINEILSKFDLT